MVGEERRTADRESFFKIMEEKSGKTEALVLYSYLYVCNVRAWQEDIQNTWMTVQFLSMSERVFCYTARQRKDGNRAFFMSREQRYYSLV